MKNKKNKSIKSPSNKLNKSFSLNPKYISIKEDKKSASNKNNLNYYSKKQKSRQTKSLEELSKKFIKCVFEFTRDTINMNEVKEKIKVTKRRIYDITNVLEGK